MKPVGWVKLHRQIIEAPWYTKSQYVHLWYHILMAANHQPNKWLYMNKPYDVKRGQFITSRKSLSIETGIPESTINHILDCFEAEGQIERQNLYTCSCISIVNYDLYQSFEQQMNGKKTANEPPVNGELPANEQPENTIEECINDQNVETVKNDNNNTNTAPAAFSDFLEDKLDDTESNTGIRKKTTKTLKPCFSAPTVEEVKNYIITIDPGKSNQAEVFHNHYESNGWMVGKTRMVNWQASVRGWLERDFASKQKPSGLKGAYEPKEADYAEASRKNREKMAQEKLNNQKI